jgi:phosphonate transport system permease protein
MLNSAQNFRRSFFDGFMFAYIAGVAWLYFFFAAPMKEIQNLGQNFFVFFLLLLLGGFLSSLLNKKSFSTLGNQLFMDPQDKVTAVDQSFFKSVWGWQLLLFLLVTFSVGSSVTRFSIAELLDQDGFAGAVRLFQGLASPNWDLLPRAVSNIVETIFMAFMATAMAIPIAFVFCFFAAQNIVPGKFGSIVYFLLRTLMNITRSIEALIWAIIFSVWVGIGPFAGMLALMIHSIASLTKQYSEIVETVSEGPIEGIKSTGATTLQTIWYAIVPQVILPFISFTIYRWDINIRMATIIGLVGGGGIGTLLIQYQGQAMWHEVGTIIVVIAFVVWFMDTASASIREALK